MRDTITIRHAEARDLEAVFALLRGTGLPTEGVHEHFRRFFVTESEGTIIGCVGMEVYERVSLLRSLAVAKDRQSRGLGSQLTQYIIAEAARLGVREIVLLTTTADRFFRRFGFEQIAREEAPREVYNSVEFQSACPATATCMRLRLAPKSRD